jgi:hypothetical protein
MKLISVKKSTSKGKKFMAEFLKDGEKKLIHFGATGYLDFTIGATEEQRRLYRIRHASGKNAPADTANALSYHILWGDSRSRIKNIEQFKKKYNL